MITRRGFNAGLVAGAAALNVGAARAAEVKTIRLGNASGVIDVQAMFMTIGKHKALGYFAEEGVDLEMINMTAAGQITQSLMTNQLETSAVNPLIYLNLLAKDPKLDMTYPYCFIRQPHWYVGVKPDSPIKSLAELRGKKVGFKHQSDGGWFGALAMLREIGIDPDKEIEWVPIGDGGPAGNAVYRGMVDAYALWDGAFARVAVAGFPMRALPNSPGMQKLFANGFAVRRSELKKNRAMFVGFFRAMAKSTVFAFTNPDAAIRLHWEVYPETKPKGKTDKEAHAEARMIVDSRKDKWFAPPWDPDKRLGAMNKAGWEAYVDFAGLKGKVADVTPAFTNDLLDEVNAFDKAAIEAKARSWT
ncbi:MAG: ABC transporter substrate-binding protein [Variibacter sp.]|nr:ABC transporter substrate-binding protein [Variibacter sp.]